MKTILFLALSICAVALGQSAYQQASAEQKMNVLWQNVLNSEFTGELPPLEGINLWALATKTLSPKADHDSDFAPKDWVKSIHKRSAIAKIRYQATQNSYTGILQESAIGLIRVSLTFKPDKRGVAPGVALKFLIDGQSSANISLLPSLDSQEQDYNIFKAPFTKLVPPSSSLGARFIAKLFKKVSKRFNAISAAPLAKVSAEGIAVEGPNFPYQIFLVAIDELQFASGPARDFREDLQSLKANTLAFEVFALSKEHPFARASYDALPVAVKLMHAKKIGEIYLDSMFRTSEFSDTGLFFRHERF